MLALQTMSLCQFALRANGVIPLRSISTAILALTLSAGPALLKADSLTAVTDRASLPADLTLDWSGFGPPNTSVISGSSLAARDGLVVTVSQTTDEMQIRQEGLPGNQDGYWKGDFLPGQTLLTNWNSPFSPVTISFSSPVAGAGLQIEPGQVQDLPASFTAFATAYDGSTVLGAFSTTGVRALNEDGSAPFLGVTSDMADITSISYRVVVQTNGPYTGDLGMNFLSIQTVPTPEPAACELAIGGLAAIALVGNKRRRS